MPTVDELYKEAETLKRAGKLEEAIAILEELLKQDELHVLSHLALAVMYGKVGKHAEAVKHGERAVEIAGTRARRNPRGLPPRTTSAGGARAQEGHQGRSEEDAVGSDE